ncbi:unnamed protein product [Rotaria magnacalcarata]|uniref:Uncharacterized protein n=1 Tax=Rotaria magnacalcarata TaxID=392030 RepID=A0A820B799_9BILA|nr:unnamed protein product [Rotaria magnacalcarata]
MIISFILVFTQFRLILTIVLSVYLISLAFFSQYYRPQHLNYSKSWRAVSTPLSSHWVREFRQHERKIFSQNGEDGVLIWLFANIGTVNRPPRFVEFGVSNGEECNTRFLREHLGWQGLMMDGTYEKLSIHLHRENISSKNINELLTKYKTPTILDLLSIDLDFDDYFVWKSILQANRFRARVVIIEFNYMIPANENRVVDPTQDARRWTGTDHFGAGILALAALGQAYGYTLVYGEQNGVNLFFVQKHLLVQQKVLGDVLSVEQLHVSKPITGWSHKPELDHSRSWIWNDTIWKL